MTRCLIIGSGPSAKNFSPPDGITVFAVNGVVDWIDRLDFLVTNDHSPANLHRLQNPRTGVIYCAAFPEYVETPKHVLRFSRSESAKIRQGFEDTPEWWFHRWGCIKGLTNDPTALRTGNSAYSALNLAYHMGFTEAALIGVDGTSEPRVDGSGKPLNLSHLPMLFESALPQIRIINLGNLQSELIPRE